MIAALCLGALLSFQGGTPDAGPEAGAATPPAPAADSPDRPAAERAPAPAASAARVRLNGRVVARGTRDPVAAASLLLDAGEAGESAEDGRFSLEVAPGPHRLQIQA